MLIDFETKREISVTLRNGKTKKLFKPGEVYKGIRYSDGRLVGKSPKHHALTELDENDIFVVQKKGISSMKKRYQ